MDYPVSRDRGAKLRGLADRSGRAGGGVMRAVVTCECCGHRQAIARQIVRPESFNLVCHSCEGVLRVEVTVGDLAAAQHATGKKTQPVA